LTMPPEHPAHPTHPPAAREARVIGCGRKPFAGLVRRGVAARPDLVRGRVPRNEIRASSMPSSVRRSLGGTGGLQAGVSGCPPMSETWRARIPPPPRSLLLQPDGGHEGRHAERNCSSLESIQGSVVRGYRLNVRGAILGDGSLIVSPGGFARRPYVWRTSPCPRRRTLALPAGPAFPGRTIRRGVRCPAVPDAGRESESMSR
jgi:hypothetical protein